MLSSTNYLQLVFYIREEDQAIDILKGAVSLNYVGVHPNYMFCFYLSTTPSACYFIPSVNVWIGIWIAPN